MYDLDKNKVVETYARFMVQTKGVTMPHGCFYKRRDDLRNCIPKDAAIVSHNGTLSGEQKRQWGVDPFKKATKYKTKLITRPANLYPCLLTAFDISKSTSIPLTALTIGHMQHQKGRFPVDGLVDELISWIALNSDSVEADFFEMWDHFSERETLHSHNWEGILGKDLGSLFDEWNRLKGVKLVVTQELEEERHSNAQWGAW